MPRARVTWGVLVALALVLLTPGIALAEQENYYLGPDGVPQAQLMMNPLGGEMPNFDRGRDVEPGLLLGERPWLQVEGRRGGLHHRVVDPHDRRGVRQLGGADLHAGKLAPDVALFGR